jgi:rRNA maturation RNase YbeY
LIDFKNAPTELKGSERLIESWLKSCTQNYGFNVKRVVYKFLNNEEITEANERFLSHDYPTDIITFNYSIKAQLEAEMLLGFETIEAQAGEYQEGTLTEYCRVMVHGLLHCCGFNDKTKEERAEMRKQENFCLSLRPKKLIFS